ncbi:MAG: type II secretion system protein GspN [SAR324 cluster bacterium]|nr:type II secretion system protein GspN [SAR324 cluster bacterium]
MKWIIRLFLLFLAVPFLAVIVFWGLKNNFPDDSLADMLEQQAKGRFGIPLQVSPVQLKWQGIHVPEVALLRAGGWKYLPRGDLFVMENLEFLFLPALMKQNFVLKAESHGGDFELKTDLFLEKQLSSKFSNLQLQRIPALSGLSYAEVTGVLDLETEVNNLYALRTAKTSIPEGLFKGTLESVKIRLIGMAMLFPQLELPPVEFKSIDFMFDLGPVTKIQKINLKGMLTGTMEGILRVNPKNPPASLLDMRIQLVPSPEISSSLGSLAVVLKSYQCGNRIDVQLKGPLNRMPPPKRKPCS